MVYEQGTGEDMNELLGHMKTLGNERVVCVAQLNKNTIQMRQVALLAKRNGQSAYAIAKLLGVTPRTVSLWLKK